MSRIATLEEILAASEREIPLPGLSKTVGEPRTIKVRKLSQAEFRVFLPPNPPGSESWDPKDWEEKEKAWVATLEPAELAARVRILSVMNFHVLATVALEPTLTLEQAKRLGNDATIAAAEVLIFSELAKAAATPETKSEEPPAANAP